MELSIIIPTLGRKNELQALLESIVEANFNEAYEVIVIDQNENHLIDDLCNKYKDKLLLTQYTVQFKGASKARNYGVSKATGKIVCFPDDDAEFCKDTIKTALEILKKRNADCVFGKVIDKNTKKDVIIEFQKSSKYLNLNDFEGAFVEATMFAHIDILKKYPYDENMGVGTIRGAEEAYDLVYRLLQDNKVIFYDPSIVFYHPSKIVKRTSVSEVQRAFYYSCGFGYLCKKHEFSLKYKRRILKLSIVIPIIAILKHKELKYFLAQWMGLKLGYKYL